MSDNNQQEGKGKATNKTQVILIVGIIVILAAVGVSAYFVYQSLNKPAPEKTNSYVVNSDNLQAIEDELALSIDPGMFRMKMNMAWVFESGDQPSRDAYVANSESNTLPFYFEVRLEDTGELVYTSTVVPVGMSIKEIVLDKPLEKGTYTTVCTYNMIDDQGETVSTVDVNLDLIIEN